MENASKALLIAGAIIIVILIIAVGMAVFNASKGSVNEGIRSMSTTEKQMFNGKWTIYEGSQSGRQIKDIYSAVTASNSDTANPQITMNDPSALINAKTYTVTVTIDSTTGLVSGISWR